MSQERSSKSGKNIKWGKALLIAIVFTLIIRCFLLESYTVLSGEMNNTILKDEFLFVDKTAYGIRLPITLLSIPFVSDSIPYFGGMKTYSTACQLPYFRIMTKPVKRNDVIVFNNPADGSGRPLDKKAVCISRCVALPGDTFEVKGFEYFVNGEKIIQSPATKLPYKCLNKFNKELLGEYAPSLNIKIHTFNCPSDTASLYTFFLLSRYEHYLLQDALPGYIEIEPLEKFSESCPVNSNGTEAPDYKIIVPENCYWVLSDNPYEAADSRYFGFIPHSHLIGKAKSIWFSYDSQRVSSSKNTFQNILSNVTEKIRWHRIFKPIN